MSVRSRIPAQDTRTPARKEADEAIALAAETGNWDGFESRELCTLEGAKLLIEFSQTLEPQNFLAEVTKQPFRWQHLVFRIVRCDYAEGQALVETVPHHDEFVAEVKKRIEQNRFHVLPYYQGFGFISFPEDYGNYQD